MLYNLPGELVSTYVYTCLTQKVTERERRRILAQKEKVRTSYKDETRVNNRALHSASRVRRVEFC